MFRIAICEDDRKQQNYIKSLFTKKEYADIQEISLFDSGEALIEAYNNEQRFSIILLDMQMNELDGIHTAKIIRKFDKNITIIIISSILEYAVDGYSINAFDFILKPVDEKKFETVIDKALKRLKDNENKVYNIQMRDVTRVVKLSDIIYFESDRRNVTIHCTDEILSNNESISVVEESLTNDGFIRISRFYLLNMKFLKEIRKDDILLMNEKTLRYSKKLQRNIKERYMNFMMGEM